MVSVPGTRVEEARLAGALARLLRWEAKLLARDDHDPASRAAALRGLEWAADFARALEAETCATWLDALRERGAERPGRTPEVWRAVGAPVCVELAEALDAGKTLAPLLPDARGWRGMATAVRAYEEPAEAVSASVSEQPSVTTSEPTAPAPSAATVSPPPAGVDLSSPPFRFGDRVQVPADTRVHGDPVALRSLFAALAEWCGPYGARTTVRGGRVELAGARPSEHAEAGRIAETVMESLRLLHLAAAHAAAPLVVEDPSEGAVRWLVRLPAAEDARHLFAEAGGRRIALPWHAVVAYGLGEGGRPHVVLGRGLERIAVGLDWLHGLGAGRRVEAGAGASAAEAEAIGAVLFDSPALSLLAGTVVSDEGESYAEVALRPLETVAEQPPRPIDPPVKSPPPGDPPVAPPTEPSIDPPAEPPARPPIDPPAPPPVVPPPPPPPPAPPEAVQDPAPPADIPGEAVSPLRALVADDSFTARVFLRRMLAMRGVEVDEAEHGDEARERLLAARYDLVFLDADMPGGGALAIGSAIDAADRDRVVVLVRDEAERSAAIAAGFAQALFKPFAEDEVAAALAALAEGSRPGA